MGFELLALSGGRQTQDVTDSSYLSYKHKSFTDSGCLYFLETDGGLRESKHRSFTYSGYLFLYWMADYWKTSTGASRTQATCSFTGWRITGTQAQELHVLRLLVLLWDGGLLENKHRSFTYSGYLFFLLDGRLLNSGLTGAQDGRKAATCLFVQTF
jgi:hypothetical protein